MGKKDKLSLRVVAAVSRAYGHNARNYIVHEQEELGTIFLLYEILDCE
jgi:hypothetical protein